jgi:molybdopterin-binding protein
VSNKRRLCNAIDIVELADGQQIVSAITRTSAEGLNLQAGDDVLVIIKSTEVMIGKKG